MASDQEQELTARRARIEPSDLRLRHGRRYQRIRRAVLAGSVLALFVVPLWYLRSVSVQSAGLSGDGRWARLADQLGLPSAPPPWLGAPWSVRAFGLEFLDPVALLGLVATRAVTPASLVGALPTLLLVVLLGRFFCGWLCPYLPVLAVSNAVRGLLRKLGWRPPDLALPRRTHLYVLAAGLLATAISGAQLLPLFYPPSVIGREIFRAVFYGSFGVGAGLILLAFVFDTLVSRSGFCRHLCPGGATFALLGLASRLKVRRTVSACTNCTACDAVCNLMQQPMTDRLDSGCERCGKCVAVCPTGALRVGFVPRAGDGPIEPGGGP
jgi:ferredoxin-type protein NapH